jgi:hypothetical protein
MLNDNYIIPPYSNPTIRNNISKRSSLNMITRTINAKDGKGEDAKVFSQDFDFPESINEAISMYGEDEVFALWSQQKVVRLQASLRNPGARKTTSTYGVFKRLIDRGMDEAEARIISEYQGPADGSEDTSGN